MTRVRELLSYDPATGLFYHNRTTRKMKKGQRAGVVRPDGYVQLQIDEVKYLGHHIAWYLMTGEWGPELDHKNKKRSDNRFKNLRKAENFQNVGNSDGWGQDKRKHKLPRGVYYHGDRYRAQIVRHGKPKHLGCFDTIELAKEAYDTAARSHFGEFYRKRRVRLKEVA